MTTETLSAVDTAWLHMEDPTNLMMVTGVLVLDGALDFARLTDLLNERLLRVPRFRQRVVESRLPLAAPRWETDPTFDLRSHLHHVALAPPGDAGALRDLVSDLMSTPLDFTKPLWQFHLVDGFGPGSVLVGRLHHSIGDGIALVKVLLSMADGTEDSPGTPAPAGEPEAAEERTGGLFGPAADVLSRTRKATEELVREGMEALVHPERLLDLAARGASGADALAKLLLMDPDPETPLKGALGVAKRGAWSEPVPLEQVKAVGKALGGTVNDVLLTAVTGALRRYLEARGRAVEGLEFRAVVPVNLRQPGEEELGNRFGLVFLPLPVGLESVTERLSVLRERMDELKRSPEAVVAVGLLGAFGSVPAEIERLVVDVFGRRGTAVMTNVVGPRERISLAGVPVKELMFWVPQSGRLGLGVSILSYAGGVSMGVATDAGLVPDPERILLAFREEFASLASLEKKEREEGPAGPKPKKGGRRRR